MKRSIIILVIISLLFFPVIVHAIKTFVAQETELVNLRPEAYDPDNDNIIVSFQYPLNASGEWQTNYGDAGNYTTTITVSDGQSKASEDVLIVLKKKEMPPTIDFYLPKENPTINETESISFWVSASDLNKDPLTYELILDGKKVIEGQEYSYKPAYSGQGSHKVLVIVSDGLFKVSQEWDMEVIDVDVQKLLDTIPDVAVNENEIARLQLPDFAGYGLSYTISEPVGNNNAWQTTYDDSGIYYVEVHAEGNGFKGDRLVKVTVNDVDRLPVFDETPNQVVNENQTIKIILDAEDPDGDVITYSAENMPVGAQLNGNIFTWAPGFDTVKKSDFADYVLEKFTTLTKNFYVKFSASSNGKAVVHNVVITVKDVNRLPVLEDIAPITVNEETTIKINPQAYDLDNDKVSLGYSGFMNSDTYKSKLGDAGSHDVIVTASDGASSVSKSARITINHVNRPPVFEKIEDVKAKEGDRIVISLAAYDQDGDNLTYYIDNPPQDYSLSGNTFTWTPGYSTTSGKEIKTFDFVFSAFDGKLVSQQTARVEVSNNNRPPRIINSSKSIVGKVSEPVLMFVKAVDDDNDQLTYTWDFGLLDKYKATQNHQRIFTTSGNKIVKVIVSDGTDSVEQVINVYIEDVPSGNNQMVNASILITTRKINFTYRETKTFNAVSAPTITAQYDTTTVSSGNAPISITDYSKNVVAKVNEPVVLFVKAVDYDNDQLTYTWDFGSLETYKATPYVQRTFTKPGVKSIKVTISDGHYQVVQPITVSVVE